MATPIRFLRGTTLQWASEDPVLEPGEPGFNVETRILKIGDGAKRWSELSGYVPSFITSDGSAVTDEALLAHIRDANPHPVYDDGPSLLLIYNNAKV